MVEVRWRTDLPRPLKDDACLRRRKWWYAVLWNWRSLHLLRLLWESLLKLTWAVVLWICFCHLQTKENSPLSHLSLLLSFNQSSRLALHSDRRRTLSRPWGKLREMYMCRYWLISAVNIMQGSEVLVVRAQRQEKSCWNTIFHNDCLHSGSWSMVETSTRI